MKKIEAIIRPGKLEDIKEALATLNINGMSISQIMGFGRQKGWKEYVRGSEIELNFLSKIKLELVVPDEQVDTILDKICAAAYTGEIGDGKIFLSDILDAVRIRTRERGLPAIQSDYSAD